MVLYVRELGKSEKERLHRWLRHEDRELKHRARVVLLSAEGYRIPEIARIVRAHPANLRKWIHRYNTCGCDGLRTVRSGGAKPRFSEEQKQEIIDLARLQPRDLGLSFASWTLHRLAEQAEKRSIVDRISHEYVRQILMEADCPYKQYASR